MYHTSTVQCVFLWVLQFMHFDLMLHVGHGLHDCALAYKIDNRSYSDVAKG